MTARGYRLSAATRARQSAAAKRRWADAHERGRQSARARRAWADPARRAQAAAEALRGWADPGYRARRAEARARRRGHADPASQFRVSVRREFLDMMARGMSEAQARRNLGLRPRSDDR